FTRTRRGRRRPLGGCPPPLAGPPESRGCPTIRQEVLAMLPFPPDAVPPLNGVRVLDAARVLAGPFCGQLLADLGADVVKLERPGVGDDTRGWGPPFTDDGMSAYFLSCDRSKRSITLDIGVAEGAELFHRLLAKSDVLIEN